ncbi:hypothetical protein SAY87_004390 [Trapa incisa]|uniref:Flowering time control protein FCA n=1 Tax=Trapa incisa TaxID=236973 RepID=A0AAN7JSF9_9MYRT|nr:hypothetical protein SAY87_004390 [Trapa incisa]
MDRPRGEYYGNYPPPGPPQYPPNAPQYPKQPPPPFNQPPPFNGPPPDPNFNYHHPPPLPPPLPPVNGPADSFGGGSGYWNGSNGGGGNSYDGGGGAHSGPLQGRKRPRQHGDGGGYPKLYVASVPRTATVDDIRPVFEPHGRVIEVILLWDKKTGQQQGSCFVKYATPEEADRAIRALSDNFTFQGEQSPLKVRYADGERDRLGLFKHSNGGQWAGPPPPAANGDNFGRQWTAPPSGFQCDNHGGPWAAPPTGFKGDNHGGQWAAPIAAFKGDNKGTVGGRISAAGNSGLLADKVYVSGVNRKATKQEIEEIFSPYGVVEDVFIIRDEMKQSRGCAFVKFSQSDMAMSAIKSLNGTFIMQGCDLPLTVRFAEPKKNKAELRGVTASSGSYFSGHSREPVNRPAPYPGDSMGGFMPPVPPNHTQQQFNSPFGNPVPIDNRIIQQPVPPVQQIPPQLPQQPLQHLETSESSQKLEPMRSELWSNKQKFEHQESSQSGHAHANPPTVVSICTTSSDTQELASLECDWSQHICPDGFKYYYNCVTLESTWEKPDEFVRFEQEKEKQRSSARGFHSQPTAIPSNGENAQEHMQIQNSLFHQEKVQAEAGLAIVPACG